MASSRLWKEMYQEDTSEVGRQTEESQGQEKNFLHRETRNGAWITAVPHLLNRADFHREKSLDNLCLLYID